MSEPGMSTVTTERHGAVSLIRLDDGRVNAVTFGLCRDVTDAVRSAEADAGIGAIVLAGREGRFSAGFDLNVMRGGDAQAVRDLCADGAMLAHTLYSARVPVVLACTGHALAMGAILLGAADVRIGADDDAAKVGMNELAIGMSVPDWALTVLLGRLAPQHVQRALLTAEVYTPSQAVTVGYLDEVVAPDQVVGRAIEVAARLAESLDPAARWTTLQAVRGATLERLAAQAAAFRATGTL